MSELIISDVTIHQDSQNRYCLNDLHKAAGNENKHRPSLWLQNKQTVELVAEIEKAGIPAIQSKQQLGTFAVKPLVYAYAMWISPAFNLHVINAYDALVTAPQQTTLPPTSLSYAEFKDYYETITWIIETLTEDRDLLLKTPFMVTGAELIHGKITAYTAQPAIEIMPPQTKWRRQEIQELKDLYQAESSYEEIGKKLGRTVSSVKSAISRHVIKQGRAA